VNIPSYLIDSSDMIQLRTKEKSLKAIRENLEMTKGREVPAWLQFDPQKLEAKVLRLPEKEDIPHQIQEQLIVELYSK